MSNETEIPRRNQINRWTAAERAIAAAVHEVEAVGADVRLTDAVVLLQAARESVADYVDDIVGPRRFVQTRQIPDGRPVTERVAELTKRLEGDVLTIVGLEVGAAVDAVRASSIHAALGAAREGKP